MLLIFEYSCLNWFCKPCQSTLIGLKDSYHNLASPINVRQNLWTLIPSWNWCVFIQLLVLSKWASASSSCFPGNSGLKYDQFKCGIHRCTGCWGVWGAEGAGISGAYSPASAIFYLYWFYYAVLCYILFFYTRVLAKFPYTFTLSLILFL